MGKPRRIADLLADTGDVKSEHLGNVSGHTPEGTAVKSTGEVGGTKFLREDGDNTSSWQTISIPSLDSPSITGTLFVDSGSTVSHTISNWSDDVTYVITGTNCTLGSVNSSGVFVVTHTSGTPSYTIKATTTSLGLDDSALVTKNIGFNLTAPTISAPADVATLTDVVYTITSTDSNDDKIILDMGSSNFNLGTVSPGSGTKSGNTVVVTGFTTGNPVVTIQFTAQATYSVTAKSVNIAGTYGDSALSSADSITIANTYNVDYLVIAGGGGGGNDNYPSSFGGRGAGGGGAGGYRNSYNSETSGGGGSSETVFTATSSTEYTVTVGAGGAGMGNDGSFGCSVDYGSADSGSNSVFGSITSTGGGGGGGHTEAQNCSGLSGGSGGGASNGVSGGSGTSNQGYAGGNGHSTAQYGGGGGGGASAVGGNGSGSAGGTGGTGLNSSITGGAVSYAGGGGGGGGGVSGGAGSYGGGNGSGGGAGNAGTVGRGSGGGSSVRTTGGQGGSGVVVLRMLTSDYSGTITGAPNVGSSGLDTILTFSGSGTYTA
jgi:hypothetical protein